MWNILASFRNEDKIAKLEKRVSQLKIGEGQLRMKIELYEEALNEIARPGCFWAAASLRNKACDLDETENPCVYCRAKFALRRQD